ncbi:hypothetical protein EC957_005960 [Mortierella hygrophila]|uniref:ER transporter 6TM N-terminal domain-containing protein n=1 Tax=Mortierella hygrophila TaxID=979708 RepID=A0A9P6JYW4_9FUNG|nr:hypothetical protein EC957_005960 [Mortierella hygrophila]
MAIFDPAPDVRPKSARSSVDHERLSHRMTISRPPSIESINSANSVPFAPPPPPPPSAWKRFTNHFSRRVIKRHVKFIIALYISSALALITPIATQLGPAPYMANVAVVFMHPSRTVGSQLEVTFFSVIGGILGAAWIIPCQVAVAAFNQRYLAEGNTSAWAIEAAWFFVGVWIMTLYKTRYAKLNCTFVIYTIVGIFTLTTSHTNLYFNFFDFWNLMGPMMIGVFICLFVSIVFWPETASEGLGRALNESMDTSRSLLNLSTRAFLLNHKTIALPKSAIDKAQAEVRTAQKKLFSAYREARYEVTYSRTNPADYKEVKTIVSALMRHLASMSLVVQNERLLMLGHPDRDDEDLMTQSGGESDTSFATSDSSSESDSDSDLEGHGHRRGRPSRSNSNTNSGEHINQQADYFGSATAESTTGKGHRSRNPRQKKLDTVESPTSDDGNDEPHHRRIRRRGSAAELRRIRQLLQRAENSTQAALKAKQQQQDNAKKESLQQTFQFDRGGFATAPPTPGGRGSFNVFGYHQAHRSRNMSPEQRMRLETSETLRPSSGYPSNATTPNSSRPSSIYEETNLDTVKSFRSLFSVKSASRFKTNRPSSLKEGFKPGNSKWGKGRGDQDSERSAGIPLDLHYATVPAGAFPEDDQLNNRHYRTVGGIRFGTSLTDQQVRKAAEAYRKKQEKQTNRERKQAERERRAEEHRIRKQEQAIVAARAIPPKEVAFGDRKLFMSFLDIVRDPLQRLSGSCSRVMVALEMELVSGLNVEQDRLERIRRRNAQREAAIRAFEAKKAEDEKAAANGATVNTNAAGNEAAACEAPKEAAGTGLTALDRLRALVGVKSHKLTKEDLDYAEALQASMGPGLHVGDKGKKGKKGKDPKSANTVHPNKFLQQDTLHKMTSSGLEEEEDFALPPGMSYVQYLTEELEVFDKAEAQGLQDFIATHPTLDVGPREEIFLIFFFLFALREIARELLRLGKYVEELEEQGRRTMELEGRNKRKKKLWWPKVFGNFWHWFSWGSYSQVKTSEGYNSLIRNSAKNLEHRQPKTVEEEKVIVEAKAAKTATDKLAAEVAAEAAADKREELQRRVTHLWAPIPLRRTVTLSNLIHRRSQDVDLEQGHDDARNPRGQEKMPQERRSRSNSRLRTGNAWTSGSPRRHRSHQRLFGNSHSRHEVVEEKQEPDQDLGNPYVLGNREDLQPSPENEKVKAPEKSESKQAGQYSVVEIPSFRSLGHKQKEDLRHFDDTNQVELLPKIHVIKPNYTAPPELDINKLFKARKSPLSPDSDVGEGPSVLPSSSAMSPKQQVPSFSSSMSPALLPDHHPSSGPAAKTSRKEGPYSVDSDSTDSDSEHQAGKKDKKSRARNLFSGFSGRHSSEDNESESTSPSRKKSPSPAPAPPEPPRPRTIFVNVPKPKTWRYWFWENLQPFKSEEFKFGFKMAIALTFIGLWSWLKWNNTPLATDRGQWAMLTVMAVLSPTVGATFSVCAMRVAGTLAGTFWALITYLVLPRNPWVICAFMLVVAFASVFLILETAHPKLGIIMILSYSSVTFIMYENNATETIYQVCYKRSITVIIGIIISVVMNSLLWPILARRELRKEIAILIGRQGVLFAELINKFFLEEQREGQGHSHYVANWPENAQDDDDDDDLDDGEVDERAALARALEAEHVHDSFVERAERAERASHEFSASQDDRRKGSTAMRTKSEGQPTDQASEATNAVSRHTSHDSELLHQVAPESTDPDRLAFQHVEQQLQTKLIKINQLLELSASEPRLKEKFPIKLYNQIIQCCQNILDRMVSMRMAAQLISPEVRELVTGPMNYYRRDMVGALLLYFSVLSSSLASKSPLPPYLPSARVARLRVIYNVREAIAAHQAVTKEDHYTYIYYYAFSSALEEVIEELELLAILIKPIVGVTMVSSGNRTDDGAGGLTGEEFNFGTAVQTNCIGLPETSALGHPAPGSEALHGQGLGVGGSIGGSVIQNSSSAVSSPAIPVTMINIGASDSTTAGMGAGAFGQINQQHLQHQQQQHQHQHDLERGHEPQQLEYPHDLLQQQQHKLMQDQAKMQQMQQQIEAQQKLIQQQQLQIQQQQKTYNFHPDLAIATSIARAPQPLANNPAGNLEGGAGSKSSLLSGHSVAGSIGQGGGGKDKRPSVVDSQILNSASAATSAHHQYSGRRKSSTVKPKVGGLHVDIPSTSSASVPQAGGLALNTSTTHGGMKLLPSAVALATSPIIMMDESLLGGGRHSQRFKDALQVAQEASGQKVIEVRSPTVSTGGVMVIPAQVQLPMGATSTGSTTKKSGTGSSSNVPTLNRMLSSGTATASSTASPGVVVAPPKMKSTNAGPSATSFSGHLPEVTVTLPGPQQQAQPHQQRMQRPSLHPFTSQTSQGSVSGHGHFGSLPSSSADRSVANGGEGPSTATDFVLNLPARVIVPTTTTTT